MALVGAAFVPSASFGAVLPRSQGPLATGTAPVAGGAAGDAAGAAPLAAAGVIGAVLFAASRKRGRASRVPAEAKVLTKDAEGRFRFDVEVPALVPSEQPGVTKPFGFFDPLGFSKSPLMTFKNDPNGFKHLREAEIKHGRIAMMGSVGSVVAHSYKMPGFEGVPTGLAALSNPTGATGCTVLFFLVGMLEYARWTNPPSTPGSYGDPFGVKQFTTEMRTKELNNGRMAMFAVMGQIAAELVTGEDPIQQFGL
uniref:Uncharacterized protein n=1 Tax=Alexandrium catenella TaxID=2925 RepID=A0A7S1R9F6_ALECA|mmetsp:Transcript_49037/g.131234  ORF Transcript_49037/g.131234 Transcript_49037/m.131234 type:complete len:253 (+) Transcript_49037:76-834(+)